MTIAFLVLSLLAAETDPNDVVRLEQEKMAGKWVVQKPDLFGKRPTWQIEDGGQLREGDDDQMLRFLTLRPDKTPREIDLTLMAQPDGHAIAIYHGIYTLQGDELRIYYAPLGEKRPMAMPKNAKEILVLKRQK